jgi:macrophage erythroblast attacher
MNQVEKLVKKETTSPAEIVDSLTSIVDKLRTLKRKSADLQNEEKEYLSLIKKRVEYFKEYSSSRNVKLFRKQRLDRMLVDYFLRSGYYNTAQFLANKSQIQDMTNIDIYLLEKEISDSLHNKDTTKCLAWCNDNKSKLKKINVIPVKFYKTDP